MISVQVTQTQCTSRSAQRQRQRLVTLCLQTSHLQQGENPSLLPGQTLYQTSRHCCTHSAALHRMRKGTKRGEKHLFNEPSPGCLSSPFSTYFCCRPALRSTPLAAPSKPCTTDGSSSIHRRDLWSLIAGKWIRGWGGLRGEAPALFSSNLKKKRELQRGSCARLGVRRGELVRLSETLSRLPSASAETLQTACQCSTRTQ